MNSKDKGIKNLDKLYGNHKIFSPDGDFMFMGNTKKINWYLDKGLAETIKTDDDGGIHIKLSFTPNGLGHDVDDPYYLTSKENICVVTGDNTLTSLTKHHVIPYCFRKHFELRFKDRSSHDVVLITRKQHYIYENKFAMELKNEIAIELGVPTHDEYSATVNSGNPARSIANTLIQHHNKIPMKPLLDLMIRFEDLTDIKCTMDNIVEYVKECNSIIPIPWGKLIVDEITDIQEFSERWRQHFVDSMNPNFMPDGWDIKRNIDK